MKSTPRDKSGGGPTLGIINSGSTRGGGMTTQKLSGESAAMHIEKMRVE